MAATWTVTNLAELENAIAQGARRFQYKDRVIDFRTLEDLTALRRLMREELGQVSKGPRIFRAKFDKGLG